MLPALSLLRLFRTAVALAAVAVATSSCEKIDSNRIPPVNVNLMFNTIGDWQLYGVNGGGQTRDYIKSEGKPAGYPYKMTEYTGYGGVMIVCDPNGDYIAYDLSCPVEVKPDVRIQIDKDNALAGMAKCPKCGSTYDLFSQGAAISGEAWKLKYGLERYVVMVGASMPPYACVRR